MAWAGEVAEAFAVDVEQITGTRPLVTAWLFARGTRPSRQSRAAQRAPDGRMRMTGLAGDQSWPPAGATPGRADPSLLACGKHPRAALWPGGPIEQTDQRIALCRVGG